MIIRTKHAPVVLTTVLPMLCNAEKEGLIFQRTGNLSRPRMKPPGSEVSPAMHAMRNAGNGATEEAGGSRPRNVFSLPDSRFLRRSSFLNNSVPVLMPSIIRGTANPAHCGSSPFYQLTARLPSVSSWISWMSAPVP